MTARKAINKRFRFEVFKRDLFCCQYCGSTPPNAVLEIDHINPVCNGGSNDIDNLITACFDCNRGKGGVTLDSSPETLLNKAETLKERVEQLKAYEKLMLSKKSAEDRRIDQIEDAFRIHFSDYSFSLRFRESVRIFIQKLPVFEVVEYMHLACNKLGARDDSIKYFCGICWNSIRGINKNG